MNKVFRMAALASVVFLASPLAYAAGQGGQGFGSGGQGGQGSDQGAGGGGPGRAFMACKDDAQTFCKGIQPGGGRIRACLEDHYKEISDACYNLLKNAPPGPPHGGSSNGGPPNNSGPPDNGPPDDGNGPPPGHDGPPPDNAQ